MLTLASHWPCPAAPISIGNQYWIKLWAAILLICKRLPLSKPLHFLPISASIKLTLKTMPKTLLRIGTAWSASMIKLMKFLRAPRFLLLFLQISFSWVTRLIYKINSKIQTLNLQSKMQPLIKPATFWRRTNLRTLFATLKSETTARILEVT